jgi:hypothetical protein
MVLGQNMPGTPGAYTPDLGTWTDVFPIALLQCIGMGLFKVVFLASEGHGLTVVSLAQSTSVLGLRPTALTLIDTTKYDWPIGAKPQFCDRDWADNPLTYGSPQAPRQSSGPTLPSGSSDPTTAPDSHTKVAPVSAKRAKEMTDLKVFGVALMKSNTAAAFFTGVTTPLFNSDLLQRVRGAIKRWWPAFARYKIVTSDILLTALLSFSYSCYQAMTLLELASILERTLRTVSDLKQMISLWLGLLDVLRVLNPDTDIMPVVDGYWASLGNLFFSVIQPLESMDQLSYEFALTLVRDLLEALSMLVRNEYFLSLSGPDRLRRLQDVFKLSQITDIKDRAVMFNSTNRGASDANVGEKRASGSVSARDPTPAKKPSTAPAGKPKIPVGDQMCISYLLHKRSIPGIPCVNRSTKEASALAHTSSLGASLNRSLLRK